MPAIGTVCLIFVLTQIIPIMKKYIFAFVLLLPFASCVSKKDATRLNSEKDSLAVVVAMKDSVINDVFAAMNDIAENLNNIAARENIINTTIGSGEIRKQTTAQINENIEAINNLLLENRETITRLRRSADQLNQAKVKISGLEKLIGQLNAQIETKDQEIAVLRTNLQNLQIEVADLNQRVTGLDTQVSGLSQEKSTLEREVRHTTDQLNTGYFIIGSEKELLAKEIIYKSGFIGRTLKINESRSLDSFTQVDIRNFDEAIINRKKITVVSSHPTDSFELRADGTGNYEALVIKDKARSWEYSKVLVISYK